MTAPSNPKWADIPEAEWRGMTRIDLSCGQAVLSFDVQGEIVRMRVGMEAVRHLAEVTRDYLRTSGFQSVSASGGPHVDGSSGIAEQAEPVTGGLDQVSEALGGGKVDHAFVSNGGGMSVDDSNSPKDAAGPSERAGLFHDLLLATSVALPGQAFTLKYRVECGEQDWQAEVRVAEQEGAVTP